MEGEREEGKRLMYMYMYARNFLTYTTLYSVMQYMYIFCTCTCAQMYMLQSVYRNGIYSNRTNA